jgi:hypothetical protein
MQKIVRDKSPDSTWPDRVVILWEHSGQESPREAFARLAGKTSRDFRSRYDGGDILMSLFQEGWVWGCHTCDFIGVVVKEQE